MIEAAQLEHQLDAYRAAVLGEDSEPDKFKEIAEAGPISPTERLARFNQAVDRVAYNALQASVQGVRPALRVPGTPYQVEISFLDPVRDLVVSIHDEREERDNPLGFFNPGHRQLVLLDTGEDGGLVPFSVPFEESWFDEGGVSSELSGLQQLMINAILFVDGDLQRQIEENELSIEPAELLDNLPFEWAREEAA